MFSILYMKKVNYTNVQMNWENIIIFLTMPQYFQKLLVTLETINICKVQFLISYRYEFLN